MTAPHNFTWGISTLGCHELNLEDTCKLATANDVHVLEIRSLADRLDLPAYLDETYPDSKEVKAILYDYQVRIVALNSSFNLMKAGEAEKQELLDFVRWAETLNIPYIRIFGGGNMSLPLTTEDLDKASDSLVWWHQLRRQNEWQTQIALEIHSGFSSGERCLQLQKHAGVDLDIIWDTHHSWKLSDETLQETWDRMGSMVRHIHIKDSISVPSERHAYSYVLPGEGEFPAQEALDLLAANNYQGVVSLEWERKWHPYMPPLDEGLKALKANGWR